MPHSPVYVPLILRGYIDDALIRMIEGQHRQQIVLDMPGDQEVSLDMQIAVSPMRWLIFLSRNNCEIRCAAPSGECTKKPVIPSITCSLIPPTAPPITGFFFQSASLTVKPKPSRIDF